MNVSERFLLSYLNLKYSDADQRDTRTTGDNNITLYYWDHRHRLSLGEHFPDGGDWYAVMSDWYVGYGYDCSTRLVSRMAWSETSPAATEIFIHKGNRAVKSTFPGKSQWDCYRAGF